ncbi:GapR family DNA-binding domain-containing protein [Mesorhizobium ciceri]|uniref:GapR family DNA-binding domain-containing protein n=1 Tax=Mesorhizobium TaxID=68287 RepID=UPI0004B45664
MSDTIAAGQLRAFVERIEADIKEMNADKSEVYKEARGSGFDVKAIRKCVSKRKLDDSDREEQDAVFDMYWEALGGSSSLPDYQPRARAREANKMDRADDGSFETGIVAAGNRLEANPAGPVTGEVSHAGAGESPATTPEPFQPPAFLVKAAKPLRPLCLNPEECAGYGSHTCHRCLTAAGQSEAA